MTDRLFPGNAEAVDGEVRRLRALCEHLQSTGEAVRGLTLDRWTGRAREAFEEYRHAFAGRWFTVADLHESAATELARYQETLRDLQVRAAGATQPTADDLARWQAQLDSEAHLAALALRRATEELDTLPPLLPELPEPPPEAEPEPEPESEPEPEPESEPGPTRTDLGLDLRHAHADPALFRTSVHELCRQVLTAEVVELPLP